MSLAYGAHTVDPSCAIMHDGPSALVCLRRNTEIRPGARREKIILVLKIKGARRKTSYRGASKRSLRECDSPAPEIWVQS